jgi:hypothetical protein
MTALFDDDFESGGLTGWTQQGSPAVDATAKNFGTYGLHITASAASEYISKSFPASTKMYVGRLYFKIVSLPAAKQGIVVATGTNGMRLYVRNNGAISAQSQAGTEIITAGTYNDSAWHRLDWRFDRTGGSNATIDWQVDGAAQTQATSASAAADMLEMRLGVDGTATCEYYIDQLVGSDVSGNYPFGAYVPPSTMTDAMGMSRFFGQ